MTGLAGGVIDVHAHVGVPAVDALLDGQPGLAEQRRIDAATLGPASVATNLEQISTIGPRLVDLDLRLAAMDAARVDVQAVSAVPIPHVWAGRELAVRLVDTSNASVASFCARRSDRLVPIGTVSLQHPGLAVEQLRAARESYGMPGVQISTSAGPAGELDAPALAEFWAAAEDIGVAILIHPWGCTLGERLNAYYLFNSVGNPTETALALSRLIFSGLLERHPRLRVWSAHGGGYLASYMVRADHAWQVRADARTTVAAPSDLARRTWVDALVYTPEQLRHLVTSLGAQQVTLGSDYPFDMGVEDPVERVETAGLDDETVHAILRGNAARLLDLPIPPTS